MVCVWWVHGVYCGVYVICMVVGTWCVLWCGMYVVGNGVYGGGYMVCTVVGLWCQVDSRHLTEP